MSIRPVVRGHVPALQLLADICPRRAEGSDAVIRVFARSLPDPCLPPFSKDSIAVGHEIRLVEDVFRDQVCIVRITAEDSLPMTKNLSQERLADGLDIHQVNWPTCSYRQLGLRSRA